MMGMLWVVLFVALIGSQTGYGLPVRPTPQTYPHDGNNAYEGWVFGSGVYAAVPALALAITAVGLLFGCTWCYRHKDCKPNEGADNQLFAASATHIHERRSHPPDSGFSEPANNNISEDNNNGPISLHLMQNIANNNAAAYIVSENEDRNRVSRESVVEFEPLPTGIRVVDPLERCADWFTDDVFPRNKLQYLREIGRGWFGRVVEGEIEEEGCTSTVAVKILNQNASLEDKARFLDEARIYRDVSHENVLAFMTKCLQEDPWILIFELCSMDLQQYLVMNRPKMAILNESGVPLQLMCDVTSGLAYLHSRGYLYGAYLWSGNVLVRGAGESARAVLGHYSAAPPSHRHRAPEANAHPPLHTSASEVFSLGTVVWEVCAWGCEPPPQAPPPPDLPCPYRTHLYQVMQLCWNPTAPARPTAAQVHALLLHLHHAHIEHVHSTHSTSDAHSSAFEQRWQTLKPNTIPKLDEHRAIVHAETPCVAQTSAHLTVQPVEGVSRSSSVASERDSPAHFKSASMTNLHGSLDDVHAEAEAEAEAEADRSLDRSDGSMDPWLREIVAGGNGDVGYYRDVSDVIKNLDDILNSEKTSSSESSHHASPSRDNLVLDCRREVPVQSSMVKSPGISDFRNILDSGFNVRDDSEVADVDDEEEAGGDTVGALSHSFERHSDSTSQHTLENLTPDTPIRDLPLVPELEDKGDGIIPKLENKEQTEPVVFEPVDRVNNVVDNEPKLKVECSRSTVPELKELCVASIPRVSEVSERASAREDCLLPCDISQVRTDQIETKSVVDIEKPAECLDNRVITDSVHIQDTIDVKNVEEIILPKSVSEIDVKKEEILEDDPPKIQSFVPPQECGVVNDKESLQENDIVLTSIENTNDEVHEQIPPPSEKLDSHSKVEKTEQIVLEQKSSIIEEQTPKNDDQINSEKEIEPTSKSVINSPEEIFMDTTQALTQESEKPDVIENGEPLEIVPSSQTQTPETVQITSDSEIYETPQTMLLVNAENTPTILEMDNKPVTPILPPDTVQNNAKDNENEVKIEELSPINNEVETTGRSDVSNEMFETVLEDSNDSTAYMDLINDTNSEISKDKVDDNVKEVIKSCLDQSASESAVPLIKNESTIYLDLPSMIKDTDDFLLSERILSSRSIEFNNAVVASTPKGSDTSAANTTENTLEDTVKVNETELLTETKVEDTEKVNDVEVLTETKVENTEKVNEAEVLSETKVPDYGPGVRLTKLEQKCVPDSLSPFESPTKSHHTDTYDENSSVVLGPFENCTIELFKGVKSNIEIVDIPKEELLAFSSNFSEMNLETPSPLRDSNFLNEVPDIVHDDIQFDDIETISESKPSEEQNDIGSISDETDGQSATEKRVSPLTPPNSPGNFLASTSQQKYIVDIDLTTPNPSEAVPNESDSGLSSLQKEIELNQIELQITSKLAMAENENNLNIEYSGPLTVEGLVSEDSALMHESEAMPESYLAGNGGSVEDLRQGLTLDEECVKALRNELELKLPLAQVAAIEPQCENEWSAELPPPPELVVSYPGALSPIAEETGQQLSAYENDTNWNTWTRTESSESYPEPCNNSTDDVTDLPTAPHTALEHSTYTIHTHQHSPNHTYTIHKDITTSKEITMSADSLNASPFKKAKPEPDSPIDDRTYNKNDDEKELNCEHISQVSPFMLSPTTDTSDNLDNATGVSTLSKTTAPTDAKLSKPSDQLSKATSIDSWCSNDTLYNVEENFDDMALEPDARLDEPERDGNSESTDTLTHNDNDDDKELSRCSTYIIHDAKSEADTFSPDSISGSARDDCTYTKPHTTPPRDITADNDSTRTRDLAYGTLLSGLPSCSNCTTDLLSADDAWKIPQPELVRRSPIGDEVNLTPPSLPDDKALHDESPRLDAEPSVKRMDSVEITCLQDNLSHLSHDRSAGVEISDSPDFHYRNMANSVTSTPLAEPGTDNGEVVHMQLPDVNACTPENTSGVPNFQTFLQSAEVRPQDLSTAGAVMAGNSDATEALLEAESRTPSGLTSGGADPTPTYSDFESSVAGRPQEAGRDRPSPSVDSTTSSAEFRHFESSVRQRPQDLSAGPLQQHDSSALLLSELTSHPVETSLPTHPTENSVAILTENADGNPIRSLDISPPSITNLVESQVGNVPIDFLINFDEEETEQPHSIIITESPRETSKESINRTFDSHTEATALNRTYDSHANRFTPENRQIGTIETPPRVNGISETVATEIKSPTTVTANDLKSPTTVVESVVNGSQEIVVDTIPVVEITNGLPDDEIEIDEVKCNGSQKYATVNFLSETFEELIESNVDEGDSKDTKTELKNKSSPAPKTESEVESCESSEVSPKEQVNGVEEGKMTSVTENFLQNEKKFCQLDCYFPLLSDIRFTGPAAEIMSTSFTQDSPTEPTSPECEQDSKPNTAADILKEWDSDTDSHSTNSSSGEFIWKDGDGFETNVVPSTHFDHQRGGNAPASSSGAQPAEDGAASEASGDSASGSEGDEVEFVPSSWDCRAAPAKSSLRSLEQAAPDNKKRVVFKRQKYHCVYEYPREAADVEAQSPAAYLPDLSTYCEWDPTSAEEAELGYGQLFGAPNPIDFYPLRAGIAFGADYDEDFFISSSARPFESLGIMSTTSQFFPGMHVKPALLDRDLDDADDFPPPPSPLPSATTLPAAPVLPAPATTLAQTRTPSLDFTTPDSGVEDITPGSTTTDEDYKTKKLPEADLTQCWKPIDSGSSSESVSPSSPGGEALGGLRHTRDKLKLDLPPSPHIPSPRHNRVFNFVLDKPKWHRVEEKPAEIRTTPLVMTDETPIVTTALPLQKDCDDADLPEPTFSTFGKSVQKTEPEQKAIILTDDVTSEESSDVKVESPKVVEGVKGEGTVLDSGDEDSGIESSSKATLDRNKTQPNVS